VKTPIERFEKFFKEEGVKYERNFGDEESPGSECFSGAEKEPIADVLSVAQAHFVFDKAGNYLGVEWD